jgi:hypothetical protein
MIWTYRRAGGPESVYKRIVLRRMQNRVFFPQVALDYWLGEGTIELSGSELSIAQEQRRYRLAEAAHVLKEVTGLADANELIGRVKSKQYLSELGAELLEDSLILGDNAYEVVPGFLGSPIGTFDEFVSSPERKARASEFPEEEPRTEEDLLVRFLMTKLGPH